MSGGRSKAREKRGNGHTLQLPGHVQNALNKEERLLQQALGDLKIEVKYKMKSISQDQQLATKKLNIMERRLSMSQARSVSIMSNGVHRVRPMTTRPSTSSSLYYKSLLTPTIKLSQDALSGSVAYNTEKRNKKKQGFDEMQREPMNESTNGRLRSVSFQRNTQK